MGQKHSKKLREKFKYYLRRSESFDTQKELAAELFVGPSTLSKWLGDNDTIWPLDALQRTCELLELTREETEGFRAIAGYSTDPEPSYPTRPPPVAHFTGRKHEVNELLEKLRPGVDITLTGPGGIGKSAICAQAIESLVPSNGLSEHFPDGLIWLDFQSESNTVFWLNEIARSFNVEPGKNKIEASQAAKRALHKKKALLYLDGVEMADDLNAVLNVRGGCGVLITSRHRKDAVSDCIDIGPLPPFNIDKGNAVSDWEREEDDPQPGVTLLKAWAEKQITDEDEAHQICELVGGLPLALYLSGKYMRSGKISAKAFLKKLRDAKLDTLEEIKERQEQGVRLIIKWSVEQLKEEARKTLRVIGLLAPAFFSKEVITAALQGSIANCV